MFCNMCLIRIPPRFNYTEATNCHFDKTNQHITNALGFWAIMYCVIVISADALFSEWTEFSESLLFCMSFTEQMISLILLLCRKKTWISSIYADCFGTVVKINEISIVTSEQENGVTYCI